MERNISIGILMLLLIIGLVNATDITTCQTLNTENDTYVVTADIEDNGLSDACLIIDANNVTLDCQGYEIRSDDAQPGIKVNAEENATIKNCRVNMSDTGSAWGVYVTQSKYTQVINVSSYDNNYGIWFNEGDYNNMTNCTTDRNVYGILLFKEEKSTVRNGKASNNSIANFYVDGIQKSEWNHTIINTTVDGGFKVYYNVSLSDTVLDAQGNSPNAGAFNCVFCNNVTVQNFNGSHTNLASVYYLASENSTIQNITTSGNHYGIYLKFDSHNNRVINVTGNNNTYGISIFDSDFNLVQDSSFFGNADNDTKARGTSINNTLLNVSFGTELVEAGSSFIHLWHYRTKVIDGAGSGVGSARIEIYNSTGGLEINTTTDASGFIALTNLTEYINQGGTVQTATPHEINVTKTGYAVTTSTFNMTTQQNYDPHEVTLLQSSGISACSVLSNPNTIYNLTADIVDHSLTAPCLNVTAENVTIDLKGFNITTNDNVEGIYTNKIGTVVKHGLIDVGSGAGGIGIALVGANNTQIINVSINNSYYGIDADYSDHAQVLNSTISFGNRGMDLNYADNWSIHDNIIYNTTDRSLLSSFLDNSNIYNNTAYNTNYGFYPQKSLNNIIEDNTIHNITGIALYLYSNSSKALRNTFTDCEQGIEIYGATSGARYGSWNTIANNTFTKSEYYSIRVLIGNYNNITDNTYVNGSWGSLTWGSVIIIRHSINTTLRSEDIQESNNTGIYFWGYLSSFKTMNGTRVIDTTIANQTKTAIWQTNTSLGDYNDNYLINVSYNNDSIEANTNGFFRAWWYKANVTDSSGNGLDGATVTAVDANSNTEFALTTNSSGFTDRTYITEYMMANSTKYYRTNHTVTASLSGYTNLAKTFNATDNELNHTFQLSISLTTTTTIGGNGGGETTTTSISGGNIITGAIPDIIRDNLNLIILILIILLLIWALTRKDKK